MKKFVLRAFSVMATLALILSSASGLHGVGNICDLEEKAAAPCFEIWDIDVKRD